MKFQISGNKIHCYTAQQILPEWVILIGLPRKWISCQIYFEFLNHDSSLAQVLLKGFAILFKIFVFAMIMVLSKLAFSALEEQKIQFIRAKTLKLQVLKKLNSTQCYFVSSLENVLLSTHSKPFVAFSQFFLNLSMPKVFIALLNP